jgi:Domain of unknown function (DUF4338)
MESAEFSNEALLDIQVRPVERSEEARYQQQMAQHHYLGELPKIGQTLWYIATWREQWVAQLSLSAAALKCGVRDRWIGWDFRSQYGRLKLIANNSRFLILPEWHRPNIGSRVLSLTERRVVADWPARFGHPLLLLETFVDPRRFYGGVYRAANWIELGLTQGYRRTRDGYSTEADAPKWVFIRPLCRHPQVQLNHPNREHLQLTGAPKIMLNAEQMRSCRSASCSLPIRAVLKGDAIACRWCWALRQARRCAACAVTKPSPTGPMAWGSKPASASVVGVKTDTMSCPANL